MDYRDWNALEGPTEKGIKISLRCLHEDDVNLLGKWRSSEDMRQLLGMDFPESHADTLAWVRNMSHNTVKNPANIVWGICLNGDLVGTCGLHGISMRSRHATIAISIGDKDARGKGVGKAVYELLLKFAFTELDLACVRAEVLGHNTASAALHRSSGFKEVGRIPGWEFKNGSRQDLVTFFISCEDYLAQ